MEEINAYIYGKKIGTMIEHQGVIYFEYDKKFKLEGLEISPIKLHTLKTKDAYTNSDHTTLYHGMAGVFFDSLPDKHGMAFIDRYFEKQGLKPFEVTLLHKLAFIGDRGMGAIEYIPKEDDTAVTSDIVINAKDAYEEMKQGIQSDDSSIESLMNIRQSVSPVGGGRPKMLVQYNYDTKEIRLNKKDLHKDYKRAIIKFDEIYEGVGSIGLTKLEYIFMSMAKEIGINTSEFQLINEGDAKHLLVKRFDRNDNDEKIHMCTASGLMHLDISILKVTSYEYLFMLTRNMEYKFNTATQGMTNDGLQASQSWITGSNRLVDSVGDVEAPKVLESIKANRTETWLINVMPDGSSNIKVLDQAGKPKNIDTSKIIIPNKSYNGAVK